MASFTSVKAFLSSFIKSRGASMVLLPSSGKMRKLPARDFRTTCSPALAKFRYFVWLVRKSLVLLQPSFNIFVYDAKIMQTSAMKTCFQIAECSFIFCKDNANRMQNIKLAWILCWDAAYLLQRYTFLLKQQLIGSQLTLFGNQTGRKSC